MTMPASALRLKWVARLRLVVLNAASLASG